MYLPPPNLKTAANNISYQEAYQEILQKHRRNPAASASSVLVIVAPDVDSLCAARILETLLRQDNITHRIQPVSGLVVFADLCDNLYTNYPDLHTIILIGVGSVLELNSSDWFGNFPDTIKIHVIDSARPYDLSNLYATSKIVVWDDGSAEKLAEERTAWTELRYRQAPDDSDSESEAGEEGQSEEDYEDEDEDAQQERPRKRRKTDEGAAINPNAPRKLTFDEHEMYLDRLERYYKSGTHFGQSACAAVYLLSTHLERSDCDLLWLAILGSTYQYMSGKIARDTYDIWHAIYADEVARLQPPLSDDAPLHPDDTSIRPSEELRFALFRHWNLYDAMYHSPYVASKLGIWKERGRKRLQGLLAKMGFSLQQCQQTYAHMDMDLKKLLREKLEDIAPEYGLVELMYNSFTRNYGYRSQPLCASDVVDGVSALLEAAGGIRLEIEVEGGRHGGEWFGSGKQWQMKRDDNKENIPVRKAAGQTAQTAEATAQAKTQSDEEWGRNNFWVAYDALGNDMELLKQSLKLSMALQRAVIRQGSSLIDKQEIKTTRSFRLAMLKEGPDLAIFTHPGNLSRLAWWLVEALRDKFEPMTIGRSKKKSLPLVVACLDEKKNTYLVVGVTAAPEFGDIRRNQFGNAFVEAETLSSTYVNRSSFDANIIEIDKTELSNFLSKLQLR